MYQYIQIIGLCATAFMDETSSAVEPASAGPSPCLCLGSYWGYGLGCDMFHASYSLSCLTLPKGCRCIGLLFLTHTKIPESFSEKKQGVTWGLWSLLFPH